MWADDYYSDDDKISGDTSGAIEIYRKYGTHGKRLCYRAGDYQKQKLKNFWGSSSENTLEFLQEFLQNYMDAYLPETALPLHNANINLSGSRNKLHPLPETVLKDLETAYFDDKKERRTEVTIVKYLFVDNDFIHRFNKYLRPDAFYYYIRKVYEQSRDCFLRIVNCLRPDVYIWVAYVEYVVYMSRIGWIKKENQWDMLTILLENGFDVNTTINDYRKSRSIIWNACDTGEFEIVKSLCEKYSAKLDVDDLIQYHYDLYKKEKENVPNLILYQNISDILIRNFDIDTLHDESESGDKIEGLSVDIEEFISSFEVKLYEEIKRRKLQNIRGLLLISYKRRLDLDEDVLRHISSFFF